MPALNDLALAVEEREPGQFFWTLLEALDHGRHTDTLDYRVYRTASRPQTSHSNALALGVAELQKISASLPSAAP
ncbi:hypothetical protein [Variovorax boronicumulans]|uniref:hypothetical protein n=1 Tax=Variovorax boronicumulans TaxID=436515 RepID=UPI003391B867